TSPAVAGWKACWRPLRHPPEVPPSPPPRLAPTTSDGSSIARGAAIAYQRSYTWPDGDVQQIPLVGCGGPYCHRIKSQIVFIADTSVPHRRSPIQARFSIRYKPYRNPKKNIPLLFDIGYLFLYFCIIW